MYLYPQERGDLDVAEKRKTTSKGNGDREKLPKVRLSAKDLAAFKLLLLKKRQEILRNVHEIEGETLRKSRLDASGDLSSMPIHMADLGTDNFQQEFSLGLMDSARRLLSEIDDALARIEDGTYGICEGTGKPISRARLEAQPWARYSVEYAQMIEKGQAPELE